MVNLLRRALLMVLPILFLLASPIPSTATSVVMLSDTELIVSSRFIITGKVRSVISAWDTEHSAAWTYVEVRVDRVLKGELAMRTVVVKQIGGGDAESGMRVFGQPTFSTDQRVLLYLNTARDGTLHVAHAFMGKFSIIEDAATGRELVTRVIDSGEVHVLSRPDGETVTDRSPIESYVRKIRRTLGRETARITEIDAGRAGDPVVVVPPEYSQKKASGYTTDFVLMGGGVRWPQADTGVPVNYYVNPNQSPVAGGGTTEITRAMDAWPNQSGSSIRLQLAGQTGSCGFAMDGVNTISFGDCQNVLDPPIGCSGILAQTSVIWTSETSVVNGQSFHRLIEADVVFNNGMNCFLGNSTNLAETACHELGHSIGLDHSADPSAIMWASVRGGGRGATLGSDDRQGVLSIYPASGVAGGGGGGPISITTANLAAGVVNLVYREALTATGGVPPYRWSLISGALPPGLFLSSGGIINGVPTRAGFFSIMVLVTGSATGSSVTDSRQLSLTIREDGSSPLVPTITRVKMKKKKLWVFGESFRADSLILLNGVELTPRSFSQEGTTGTLYYKGKLSRQPDGANVVYVRTGSYWSTAYIF
jgi:hypothetical protein